MHLFFDLLIAEMIAKMLPVAVGALAACLHVYGARAVPPLTWGSAQTQEQ
jgi:hypothetical protein